MSSVVEMEATANNMASLPALIDRAASALVSARTSGELLEAKALASVAYDVAKTTARIAKAKQAHDDVIGAVYRAQADAALIEARAKMRLADEYDAAQERGEVAGHGGGRNFKVPTGNVETTTADIGLSRKEIHEARILRDAEKAQPGAIEKAVEDRVRSGQEPTKAAIKKAAHKATGRKVNERPADIPAHDHMDELAEARYTINEIAQENEELRDRLAVEAMDATDDEKLLAQTTIKELRAQVKALEAELDAVKSMRDQYMTENEQLKRQCVSQRRKLEKLMKAAA